MRATIPAVQPDAVPASTNAGKGRPADPADPFAAVLDQATDGLAAPAKLLDGAQTSEDSQEPSLPDASTAEEAQQPTATTQARPVATPSEPAAAVLPSGVDGDQPIELPTPGAVGTTPVQTGPIQPRLPAADVQAPGGENVAPLPGQPGEPNAAPGSVAGVSVKPSGVAGESPESVEPAVTFEAPRATGVAAAAAPDTRVASEDPAAADEAGSPAHPDTPGNKQDKELPEHARAHDVPGRAKEPGVSAGRPFTGDGIPGQGAGPRDVPRPQDAAPAPVPPDVTGSQETVAKVAVGRPAQVEPPAQPAPANQQPPPVATDALTTADGAPPARSRADEAQGRRDVRLTELAEQADAMIRLAVRNGLGSARITLSPQELGQIEIHLRYRSAGVIAELTAESAAAFQALNQAGADLRRSLEAQGIIVLGLDIRHAGPDGNGDTGHGRSGERSSGEPAPRASQPDEEQQPATAQATTRVLTDVAVDILA
jgi:hypothetical protein